MPYLTMWEKFKGTTKPWFSRLLRHPARKRSGSILGHNTHTYTYLLTYLLSPSHTGSGSIVSISVVRDGTSAENAYFGVFRAEGTGLVVAKIVLFLLKKSGNWSILRDFSGGVFTPKAPSRMLPLWQLVKECSSEYSDSAFKVEDTIVSRR